MIDDVEQYQESSDSLEFPVKEITEQAEEQPPLSLEERAAKLRRTVTRQPLHREVLYQTLLYAQTMRTLADLEDFIAQLPQFKEATQPQYYLIQYLVNAGGLDEYDLDAEGNVVKPEQEEGLTEDEVDDLVATWAYETTELGRDLVESMRPSARMSELLNEFPAWETALMKTVEFLSTKRPTSDVNTFLCSLERPVADDTRMQPSVFVDRLEKAGIIVWDAGWSLTDDGRSFLDEYHARTA